MAKQGYDLETVLNSTFCYKLLNALGFAACLLWGKITQFIPIWHIFSRKKRSSVAGCSETAMRRINGDRLFDVNSETQSKPVPVIAIICPRYRCRRPLG